jgi:Fe-S cluster biogenesis protein NfuA
MRARQTSDRDRLQYRLETLYRSMGVYPEVSVLSAIPCKRPVVVAEHTPNPDCVRLSLHPEPPATPEATESPAMEEGRGFERAAEAEADSPVAARLLRLDGVRRVFVTPGFVAVTREPTANWRELGPRLRAALREHVDSGQAWLLAGRAVPGSGSQAASVAVEGEIRALLDTEIRPAVRRDGGDVAFAGYADGVVRVDLRGACVGCPAWERTLRDTIERRLREAIPQVRAVVADDPNALGSG